MPENSPYDTKTLLMQVGKGSPLAFRLVFDLFKERFYTASYKMTRSPDIAEEIVQEVFINLWVKRAQVAAAENPEAYVMAMLHNSIYAHFRRIALEKTLKKKVAQEQQPVEANPVEDLLLIKENRRILETAISQLPAQQRLVYRLSRLQGLSREEIANQLHISPHTVKNHLHEAIRFVLASCKAGALVLAGILFRFL